MSDLAGRLRSAATVYDASYPPSLYGGSGGSPTDPHIDAIVPNSFAASTPSIILTLTGSNFAADSVVEIDQVEGSTVYDSATQLRTQLSGSLGVGSHLITVRNVNNEESNSVPITVTATAATVIDVDQAPAPKSKSKKGAKE